MNGSHSPGVFTSFFPNSAAMFQDHSLPQNRNLNTKYFSRMSESEGQSSQLPEQGFNIPDEFRLTPDARFGEQLGLGGRQRELQGRSPTKAQPQQKRRQPGRSEQQPEINSTFDKHFSRQKYFSSSKYLIAYKSLHCRWCDCCCLPKS